MLTSGLADKNTSFLYFDKWHATGELVPPTVYPNKPTPNNIMMVLDRNKLHINCTIATIWR